MVGKLERVPLREVWTHEAPDFIRWLVDNIDVLNDALDLSLSNPEPERPAGDFTVDIVAEDSRGPAVIECQLEKSNHDHLGKLITYLAAIGAKTAVWIVSDPRPEHVGAISWLNEAHEVKFFVVKAEAVRIGNSEPAPLLTLIVGPSEEIGEAGDTKKELSERDSVRYRFWQQLLDRAKAKTKLHAAVSATSGGWIMTGAGKAGFGFSYVIRRHESGVELYIDRGKDAVERNKEMFDLLARSRTEIESAFGGPLVWERLEGKQACRISKRLEGGYLDDETKWPGIQDAMIDAMIRLDRALRPHIDRLCV